MKYVLRFVSCNAGVAMVEFVIMLPVMLMLLVGTAEVSRYIIIQQKLDKTTHALGYYVTQPPYVHQDSGYGTLIWSDFIKYNESAVANLPADASIQSTIFFTHVTTFSPPGEGIPACTTSSGGNTPPHIDWQFKTQGGSTPHASEIGNGWGSPASFSDGYTLNACEDVMVVEIFYDYEPIVDIGTLPDMFAALTATPIYSRAIYKPRQDQLTKVY